MTGVRNHSAAKAAYHQGFEDGRDSVTALPVLLAGVIAGALSMAAWFLVF